MTAMGCNPLLDATKRLPKGSLFVFKFAGVALRLHLRLQQRFVAMSEKHCCLFFNLKEGIYGKQGIL